MPMGQRCHRGQGAMCVRVYGLDAVLIATLKSWICYRVVLYNKL
jgi:hypothetical protein